MFFVFYILLLLSLDIVLHAYNLSSLSAYTHTK